MALLELPIQQRLRNGVGWQIGDGSEEVMKLITARELVAARRGPLYDQSRKWKKHHPASGLG
jgi:hypothetical protein